MPLSFDSFDPERLIPESVRPEIYGLAMQNDPKYVDGAQARLSRYINDFRPTEIYEEVYKPTKKLILTTSVVGAFFINSALSNEDIPPKLLYGGTGLMWAYLSVKSAVIRYSKRKDERELSDEAKRYLYLKFFEKKES